MCRRKLIQLEVVSQETLHQLPKACMLRIPTTYRISESRENRNGKQFSRERYEMWKRWEEISKEEETILQRQTEGGVLHMEGMPKVPELVVSQLVAEDGEPKEKEMEGKVAGWSTENMEEKASNQLVKDTEDMVNWRSTSQELTNKNFGKSWL